MPKKSQQKKPTEIQLLRKENKRLRSALNEFDKKYAFKHIPGRKVLIIQIGDATTGWLGSSSTISFLIRQLKQAHMDEIFNIIIYHYAANFITVDSDGNFENIGKDV